MEHLPAIITALVGVMTTIGAGLAYVRREFKAEQAARDAQIAAIEMKYEDRLSEIDEKLEECHRREIASHERRAKHLTVIELLWREVERLSPKNNRVLTRAKHLLDELKDVGARD